MKNLIIFLFVYILSVTSCTIRQQLTPKEYLSFIRENENVLIRKFDHDSAIFTIEYRPSEIFLAEQLLKNEANKIELAKKFNGSQFFVLTINSKNNNSFDTENMNSYIFGDLENDISFKFKNEYLKPTVYNVENTGFTDSSLRVFLGFDTNDVVDHFTLSIKDNYFTKVEFPVEIDITKLPILKI